MKKSNSKKGLNTVGTFLIVVAVLLFIGMVINLVIGVSGGSSYTSIERGMYAARCFKLGLIPLILGIICKKCAKK